MPVQPPEQQPCRRQASLPPTTRVSQRSSTNGQFPGTSGPSSPAISFPQALAADCNFFWLPVFPRALHCLLLPSLHAAASSSGHTFWRTAVDMCFSSLAPTSGPAELLRTGLWRAKERKRRPSLAGQDYRAWEAGHGKGKILLRLLPLLSEAGRTHFPASHRTRNSPISSPCQSPLNMFSWPTASRYSWRVKCLIPIT